MATAAVAAATKSILSTRFATSLWFDFKSSVEKGEWNCGGGGRREEEGYENNARWNETEREKLCNLWLFILLTLDTEFN